MISKRLKSFVVTAQEGTIAKAAEKLFTTPPPLSRQIKLLENEIGINLFTRSNAGMKLTDKGADFYDDILQAYNFLLGYSRNKNIKKSRDIVVNNMPDIHMHTDSLAAYLSDSSNIIDNYTHGSSPDIVISPHPINDNNRLKLVKYVPATLQVTPEIIYPGYEDRNNQSTTIHSAYLMNYHGINECIRALKNKGLTGGVIINNCFLAHVEPALLGQNLTMLPEDFFNTPDIKKPDTTIFSGEGLLMGYWIYKSSVNTYCDDIVAYYEKRFYVSLTAVS